MKRRLFLILLGMLTAQVSRAQPDEESAGQAAGIASDPQREATANEAAPEDIPSLLTQEDLNAVPPQLLPVSSLELLMPETNDIAPTLTTNLTVIETENVVISGSTVPALKKRSFGSFLQLFNPFAPKEYGGTPPAGGRGFEDPIESAPVAPLISVGIKAPVPRETSTEP